MVDLDTFRVVVSYQQLDGAIEVNVNNPVMYVQVDPRLMTLASAACNILPGYRTVSQYR
jgi:hypothetical protein